MVRNSLWWVAFGALCIGLSLPLLVIDVPPLLDYPNHLARMIILASSGKDSIIAEMYEIQWAIIPDLAIDLIIPPLLSFLPPHIAGRVAIEFGLILPVLGTVSYNGAVFGKRSFWSLACSLVAYNEALMLGFLNFSIGVGLAFLFASCWIRWRNRATRLTLLLLGACPTVLFFCHLMGLLFFTILVGSHEICSLYSAYPRSRRAVESGVSRVAQDLLMFVLPAILYALSDLHRTSGRIDYGSLERKVNELLAPFVNYCYALDMITGSLVIASLAFCILFRILCVPPASRAVMIALITLYWISPATFKGAYNVDIRFVILLGFFVFGGLLPVRVPRCCAITGVISITAISFVRIFVIAAVWYTHRVDIGELRSVIKGVEPGARVLVTSVTPDEAPEYWNESRAGRRLSNGVRLDVHLPALLLIENRAFWPFLFDNPSQQPVIPTEKYRGLQDIVSPLPAYDTLSNFTDLILCKFDYILVLEVGAEPELAYFPTRRFTQIARSDMAALLRVELPDCRSRE
jgi:hypothetical protein